MNNRSQIILISACVVAALGFVAYQIIRPSGVGKLDESKFKALAKLAEHTENGVRVEVTLESDPESRHLLRATFTPTDKGFHLYSKDLDPKSVDGLGLPTTLKLLPNSSIKPSGPVFANIAARIYYDERVKVSLPIYPDGPVTLRLPIEITGTSSNIPAQVSVSYMACDSEGVCLVPVEGKVLDVTIPR